MVNNYMAKQSKLDVATDAVFVHDLAQLARDDRESVRQLKRKQGLLPPAKGQEDEMDGGNFIICDDYRQGGGWSGLIGALVLAIVLLTILFLGSWLLTRSVGQQHGHEEAWSDVQRWAPEEVVQ